MNDKVDSFVLNRSAVNDRRRKAVCCMCGTLKRPFCWANRGLDEQPFCSWKCRKLYLYGPDVGSKCEKGNDERNNDD